MKLFDYIDKLVLYNIKRYKDQSGFENNTSKNYENFDDDNKSIEFDK